MTATDTLREKRFIRAVFSTLRWITVLSGIPAVFNIDTLTVNNQSQVNVENSGLLADSITLTNASSMNIGDSGAVWPLTICIWTAIAARH